MLRKSIISIAAVLSILFSGCAKPPQAKPVIAGDVVYFVPTTNRFVALTFDDGPNEAATPAILDLLKQYGVHATFFLVGTNVERSPALAMRIRDEGHVIGNHSYAHRRYDEVSQAETVADIENGAKAIKAVLGMQTALFRPPYGINGSGTVARCKSECVTLVGWSADGNDWNPHTPKEIADSIVGQAVAGDIILLHDGFETAPNADRRATVGALAIILEGLKNKGMTCVTVPELFKCVGAPVAEFDNGVRLLGYDLPLSQTLQPKQAFYVRYMWDVPVESYGRTMKGIVRFESGDGFAFNDDHALPVIDEVRYLRVRRVLVVPEKAPAGVYSCRIGLTDQGSACDVNSNIKTSRRRVILPAGGEAK